MCSSSLAILWYSVQPRTKKYVKGYGFLSFAKKYKKHLLDAGLDSLQSTSKKVVQNAVTKWNDDKIVKPDENPRNVLEIIIPPEKEMKRKTNWENYYKNGML